MTSSPSVNVGGCLLGAGIHTMTWRPSSHVFYIHKTHHLHFFLHSSTLLAGNFKLNNQIGHK